MNPSNMLVNMLMGRLQSQNPQAYQQLQQLMNSGQTPEQIIQNMLASGQINQQQLDVAKQQAQQYTNIQNTNRRRF